MPKPGVHKDFHGAWSYCLKHVADNHGDVAAEDFLREMAPVVFAPLIAAIRAEGLPALKRHWEKVAADEEADCEIALGKGELVLRMNVCPALEHIRSRGYPLWERFCEHTRIINEAVCRAAGVSALTDYDQESGCCVQRFRMETR
ncbi:MAG TPA: hypothetical protein PL033_04450 [Candidatus Brocadiia bacterium]|nr:hypothetical protein [Candidatus Brocadiia bacterium]